MLTYLRQPIIISRPPAFRLISSLASSSEDSSGRQSPADVPPTLLDMELKREEQCLHARQILNFLEGFKDDVDYNKFGCGYSLLVRYVIGSYSDEIGNDAMALLSAKFAAFSNRLEALVSDDIFMGEDFVRKCDVVEQFQAEITATKQHLFQIKVRRRDPDSSGSSEPVSLAVPDLQLLYRMYYGHTLDLHTELDLLIHMMKVSFTASYASNKYGYIMPVIQFCTASRMPVINLLDGDPAHNLKLLQNWCSLVKVVLTGAFVCFQKIASSGNLENGNELIEFGLEHCAQLLSIHSTLNAVASSTDYYGLREALDTIKSTLVFAILRGVISMFCVAKTHHPTALPTEYILRQRIHDISKLAIPAISPTGVLDMVRSVFALVTPSRKSDAHIRESCEINVLFDFFLDCSVNLRQDSSNWPEFLRLCQSKMPLGFCSCIPSRQLFNSLYVPTIDHSSLKSFKAMFNRHFRVKHRETTVDGTGRSMFVELRRWLDDSDCEPFEFLKIVSLVFHVLNDDEQRLSIQLFTDFYNGESISASTRFAILQFFLASDDPATLADFATTIVMPNFNAHFMDDDLGPLFRNLLYQCIMHSDSQEISNDLLQLINIAFNAQLENALQDIPTFTSRSTLPSYHEIMTLMDLNYVPLSKNVINAALRDDYLTKCERLATTGFDLLSDGFNTDISAKSRLARLTAAAVKAVSTDSDQFLRLRDYFVPKGDMETVASTVMLANALLREASEWRHLFGEPVTISRHYDSDDEVSTSESRPSTTRSDLTTRDPEFIVDEDVLLLAVKLATFGITKATSFSDVDEIKLREYLVLLRPNAFVNCDAFEKIINHLFACLDHFPAMTTPPSNALSGKFITKTAEFVAYCPRPHLLVKFLPGAFLGSEALTNTAIALETMLKERPLEPMVTLRMPQKALNLSENPDSKHIPSKVEPSAAATFTLDPAHEINLNTGLTISFWMAIDQLEDPRRHAKKHVHIATIGTPVVNAQLFVATTTGTLTIRYNVNGQTIEKVSKRKLFGGRKGRWQFISLGLATSGNNLLSKYILGRHFELKLELPPLPPNASKTTFELCFGAVSDPAENGFAYSLSTMFAFKSLLSVQCAIAARSLGCESQCLMECRASELYTNFTSLMNRAFIIKKTPPLLEVWSNPKSYVSRIQRSAILVVQAGSAHCYGLSILQPGMDAEVQKSLGESVLYLTMYKEFPIQWQAEIQSQKIATLDTGFRAIGSGKLFLFLYALSVDKAYSPAAQCAALRVLFAALRRSPSLYGEFIASQGIHVLTQILNTTTAHFDDAIFDELCKFIFSELEPEREYPELLTVSFYTVILEPELLKTLISTTDLWKGKFFKYWERLIQLCASSLDNCKALFCEFNSQILAKVGFLMPLLHSLLDMQQNPHVFSAKFATCGFEKYAKLGDPLTLASKSIVASICVIVSELVPSPYHCPPVTCLWKYILLSHPAQDVYLDYNFKGHSEWIRPAEIEQPPSAPDPGTETQSSLLSAYFEKVLMNFDKDKIAEIWRQGNSVTAVREAILKTDADYRIFAPGPPPPPAARMDSVNEHTHSYPESNRLLNSLSAGAEKQVDHWLVTLRTSMLSTLCNIVLCSDDALIAVLELDVIYWKSILVQLTNQSHPNMRNQIFVLLQNFFHRCNKRYQIEFVQQHGFLILASQLRKFPVNLTIADALFSMFCGECVIIKDGLDEEHVESIVCTPFRYASFHALFALLEASAVDQALFWTVCSTLQKIFEANVRLRRAMVDCGIADTLMNVLRLLSIQQQSIKRMIGPVFPIIDCWISFARSCITNVIVFADSHMYSQSKDFLLLCAVADYQLNSPAIKATAAERLRHFSESLSVPPPIQPMACSDCTRKMVRQILCQLIEAWLDCCMAVVVDPGNALIPVDERIEGDGGDSDSSYEMYSDSDLTESSMALYGAHGDRRHKKKSFEFAGVDELAVRLCFGLQMANDLFVCAQIPEQISEAEEGLFQKYLGILLLPWKKRNTDSMDDYLKLLAGIKEQARVQLAKLIAYVLFPVQLRQRQLIGAHQNLDLAGLVRRRLQIVRSLADMLSKDRDCISSLLEVDLDYQYAAKIALHELALCPQYAEFWPEFGEPLERLIRFLRTMQVESPLANLTRDEVNSMSIDEVILLHTYGEKTAGHAAKLQNEALRLCEKSAPLTKAVQESAVTLTCSIAVVQDEPRKLYIKSRKDAINACARANEVLTNLVVELCHPFAPFYDASSWPKGWSLDTTENLHRERKRLKPSHYRFDLKFLKPEKREEVGESGNVPPPLQKLRFQEACPNFATTDYIEASNHVRLSLSAILVRSDYECSGEIIISDRKIHFLGEAAKSTQKGVTCQPVTLAWSYGQLSEINLRHYLLKDNALELFTTTGDAFLIVFATTPDRDNFVEQLNRMDIGKLMADHEKQLKLATQLWRRGSMTNFDYIMMVNKLAGRSFNDLMQYPVFPFILANYTAPVLDLNMVASYRDLSRPMAIQKKSMEEFYVRNYEQLHEESHQEDVEQFTTASFGAYHYGSHYSNTGVIAYYLVRVLPYTNVALEYQDNNFDIPDRLFNSIETAWRLSSSDSTTDFKELTPEFFFLPELFQNREQLNLGLRQAGSTVGDVVLPTWCPENNFRLFILIHRQALESAVVTANLHGWIDLIFGSKQQGPAAVKAINVFHPATYRGRDFESKQSHDEISLSALRTMIRTYGQMPTQLFLSPHLPHLNLPHPPLDAVMSPGAGETGHPSSFLPSVKGLRWGEFVGSPELDRRLWLQPVLNLNLSSGVDSIGKLVPVNKEGFCYALPEMTELVHRIVVDAKDPLRRTFETAMIAVVSWRFSDNVLRLKVVQMDDSVWVNLIDLQVFEPTRVVFSPNANQMYIGTSCGLIRVYSIDFKKDSKTWQVKLVSELFAHRSAISTLKVSDDFHLVLSTSADGQAHSWDSNQLTYIRQFVPPPSEAVETITLTAISSVSADIAIIYQSHRGSRLVLYTINGDVIGTYESDPDSIITSVAMTNMDEGTGINCIALGMQNGIVRILESWTLSLVTDISVGANVPVTSVEFTNEGRRMYVAVATGRVFCWQGATAASINATAFRGRAKFDPAVKLLNPFTD